MNKVGIFLTTFNLLEGTKKTLASLIQNTANYDLIVVDNNSTDGTQQWIKDQGIHIIEFKQQTDLTVALNAGIKYFLEKEIDDLYYDVCWIHNDMIFYPGWLDALQEYFEKHSECGKVAPHNMRDPLQPERPGNELPCLLRGTTLKQIGLYDERFIGIGGREDWDMNNRMVESNWTVMITPESKVYHEGMATRKLINTDPEAGYNANIYFQKYGTYECKV
jgi:GT2 family glycosyltransferase